jgi:deaminated glutathione amidase
MAKNTAKFNVACVQLCAGRDVAANVAIASDMIADAARQGAQLIVTPEQTTLMEHKSKDLLAKAMAQDEDTGLKAFRSLAEKLEKWLLIGSLAIRLSPDKVANRSFLIAPDGSIQATYDKIHMFDVDLPGGETYRESKNYEPGTNAVTADLPWGRLGLSVCYDLRFPALFRSMARAGSDFLAIPSAFTTTTGKAHWHVLLRARAIENGCYVFAAAQGGDHENGRSTYGHSLIVSPWGEIIAQAGTEPGIIMAEVDLAQVARARALVPSLQLERAFGMKIPIEGLCAS